MAAILNFKMAANLQHSQEVTLDFLFDFDVTHNVSKGISSTISGSMFAPSNHSKWSDEDRVCFPACYERSPGIGNGCQMSIGRIFVYSYVTQH